MLLHDITDVISRGFKTFSPDTIGSVAWESGAKVVLKDNTQVNYFIYNPKHLLQTVALGNIFGVSAYWFGRAIEKQNHKFFPDNKPFYYPIKKAMRKYPITTTIANGLFLISAGAALKKAYKAPLSEKEDKK